MEALDLVGVLLVQPLGIVKCRACDASGVAGQLHMVEPAMRTGVAVVCGEVLEERRAGVRLQMGLTDQCRLVAGSL